MNEKITTTEQMRVLALGNFDGVHIGHAALLRRAAGMAREMGLASAALILEEHPDNAIAGACVTPCITDNPQKARLIADLGVDEVIFIPFDRVTASLAPAEFVAFIREQYNAGAVVCGFHYRFGKNASGDAEILAGLCKDRGILCEILEPVTLDGLVVSSTMVRSLISGGNMEFAARLLGRPFTVQETVESGKRLGSAIGFPTINQTLGRCRTVPAFGVYATKTFLDGWWHASVTNVGVRPTVDGGGRHNVETHILGIDRDLYGQNISVAFYRHLRPETRFDSIERLRAAIERDVLHTQAYFEGDCDGHTPS